MRKMFSKSILQYCEDEKYIVLTGDLGFMALEEVQMAFGNRFINAGIAEQNMVGVAAGLAKEGFRVFVYSIAPFCYARPFEQIRNDICASGLPVCFVGNGGGYGYGCMGPTHHALEDCAAMNALGVKVLVPAFDEDIPTLLGKLSGPTYLRLGYDARPTATRVPEYAPWRLLVPGEVGAVVALGPLAGEAWHAIACLPQSARPALWAVTEFSSPDIPEIFWEQISHGPLFIFEEHVAAGGLGMHISLEALHKRILPQEIIHRYALGYPTGRFGSQKFHRAQCGLDAASMRTTISETVCV